MTGDSEYYDGMLDLLELVWGRDYMAPGGPGNVRKLAGDLDLRGKRVLDIGSGLGGPAFELARTFGAHVTGIDLEEKLVRRARDRAEELGLAGQVEFRQVEHGPLAFPDGCFDLVVSSGALTQTADKLAIFREILRILKPGGALSCYDWTRSEGEYSEQMLYWFELEGLTYAMETLDRHGELLTEAAFIDVELEDASEWYRRESRREYEQMRGPLYAEIVDLIGREDAERLVESWRVMANLCESGEMRQGYYRARRPTEA